MMKMKVYLDELSNDDSPVLIGYKGRTVEAASFYCPYVPLTTYGVVEETVFGKLIEDSIPQLSAAAPNQSCAVESHPAPLPCDDETDPA